MVGAQCSQPLDVVSPVAMQFASDGKPGHQLSTGRLHPQPSGFSGGVIECPRSISDDENFVAFLQGRQSREGNADLSHHSRDDQLFLASGFHSFDEILIIPGIDLAGSSDVGSIWEQFLQLRNQGPLGPCSKLVVKIVGNLKNLAASANANVVLKIVRRKISHDIAQPRLMIDQQHCRIVLVQSSISKALTHFLFLSIWKHKNKPRQSTRRPGQD